MNGVDTARKPRTDRLDAILGARIKTLRKERGLTQTALGERLGITFQQVQKYENGANRVSAIALLKLAEALGVAPLELMADVKAEAPLIDAAADAEKLLADFRRIRSAEVRASVLKIVASLAGR